MKKLFLLLLCAAFAIVGCEGVNPDDLQNIIDNLETPEEPVFYVDSDGDYVISNEGGEVMVAVITNLEYVIYIPKEARGWISLPETRAIRLDKQYFIVAKNETAEERSATIDLLSLNGEILQSVVFVQEAGGIEVPEEPGDAEDPDENAIVLVVDKDRVSVGETVIFTVTNSLGEDITELAQIYECSNLDRVESTYTFDVAGKYEFFACVGQYASNIVTIWVVAQMPQLPVDPNPSNFAFHHKPLVIRYAGVNCPACPYGHDELIKLAESQWGEYFNCVDCHAGPYASGDPANSGAANALHNFVGSLVSAYPTILVDFYNEPDSYLYKNVANTLQNRIKVGGADVGIALAVDGDPENVYCAAQIKSAVSQEYRVNAWLLESNIYSPKQRGATKEEHKYYDYALRNMSSVNNSSYNVEGDLVGVIEAGSTYDFMVELPITSSKWDVANMGVVVVVTALDSNNRWEVVNTAYCPIHKSLTYRYVGESENLGDAGSRPKLQTPVITSVTPTEEGDGFTVTWDEVENATEYTLYLNHDGVYYTTETSYTFTDLGIGTYYVRVEAMADGYEDSDCSKSVEVKISGPESVDWFSQKLWLPENNEENEEKCINSSNTIFFNWSGIDVVDIRYTFGYAENLPSSEGQIIALMLSANSLLSDINQTDGIDLTLNKLESNREFVLCTLATNSNGEQVLAIDRITTDPYIATRTTQTWLGTWSAYAMQTVYFGDDEPEIRDKMTEFELTITPHEYYSDMVYIDGYTAYGQGLPVIGYTGYAEDGSHLLYIENTQQLTDVNAEGYAIFLLTYASIGGELKFSAEYVPFISFYANPDDTNFRAELFEGAYDDGTKFIAKGADAIYWNTTDGSLGFIELPDGKVLDEFKYGDITLVGKTAGYTPAAKALSVAPATKVVPTSMVLAL